MKKNLLTVFIIFISFLFYLPRSSQSFEIKTEFDTIGSTCGIPGSAINKCCRAPNVYFNLETGNPLVDVPLYPVRVPVNILLNGLFQSLPNKIKEFSDKYLGKSSVCYDTSTPSTSDPLDPNCVCVASGSAALTGAVDLCNAITSASEKTACLSCIQAGNAGIWTSIGCVYADLGTFIEKTLLGWAIGLAGIVALLCIIFAAFQMQTSQGNPEKIKKAQELLTSCIMGLMLVIFSIFILRLIGVDILRIPGFK